MTGTAQLATVHSGTVQISDGSPNPDTSIVITSPGTIDMTAIRALAKALERPVAQLAKAIYHAPTVLVRGLGSDQEADLLRACCQLGLDVEARSGDQPFDRATARFDLAAYVTDPAAVPATIEVISRVVGISAEQAYMMLSTPPGAILGDISAAAADSLVTRFGDGVRVTVSPSRGALFDLYVSHDCPRTPEIERLCGERRGLVTVGLSEKVASDVSSRLPKGSVRLVARNLMCYDVVFGEGAGEPGANAAVWLTKNFTIQLHQVPQLVHHAPITLLEGIPHEQAREYAEAGQSLGLPVIAHPAGFGRFSVHVLDATNLTDIAEVLRQSNAPFLPDTLPATVATDLIDLDARWLAHELEAVGATVTFQECP